MRHVRKFKWIFISGIILLLSLAMTSDFHSASATLKANDHQKIENNLTKVSPSNQENDAMITHKQITTLTQGFMDILLQDIDENYKVINFDTKAELMDQFEQIATTESAKPYVDFYYDEQEDGLYILPTETPAWFNIENEYDVVQLQDNKVRVEQKNYDEMFGDYTIAIEFTYEEQWKISNISYP